MKKKYLLISLLAICLSIFASKHNDIQNQFHYIDTENTNHTLISSHKNNADINIQQSLPSSYKIHLYADSNSTLSDVNPKGDNIKWYSQNTGQTLLPKSTKIENNKIYYAVEPGATERIAVQTRLYEIDQVICEEKKLIDLKLPTQGKEEPIFYDSPTATIPISSQTLVNSSSTYYVELVGLELNKILDFYTNIEKPFSLLEHQDERILLSRSNSSTIYQSNADKTDQGAFKTLSSTSGITGLAQLSNGDILASKYDANKVVRLDDAGNNERDFTSIKIDRPQGILELKDGTILVSSNNSKDYLYDGSILHFDKNGNILNKNFAKDLFGPVFLTQTPDGYIWVTEYGKGDYGYVTRLDSDGKNSIRFFIGVNSSGVIEIKPGILWISFQSGEIKQIRTDDPNPDNPKIRIFSQKGSWLKDLIKTNTNQVFVANNTDKVVYEILYFDNSSNRVKININAPNTPAPISNLNIQTFCKEYNPTIADLKVDGVNINWYSTPTSNSPLPINTPLVDNKTYYATQTISTCESVDRTPVKVIIEEATLTFNTPTITFTYGQEVIDNYPFTELNNFTSVKWYDTENSTEFSNTVPSTGSLNVGEYTYWVTGLTTNGCESNKAKITFKIKPAELIISADPKSKFYGEIDPILTYNVSGLLPNDKVKDVIKGELKRESGENIGTYKIEQGTLTIEPNYTLTTFNKGFFTINAKELTISADPKSKFYGEIDPVLTYTVSGLLPTDRIEDVVKGELKRENGENVGTYKIQQGTLTINSNYTLTAFNEGAFKIIPTELIISADPKSKFYGEIDPVLTYTVSGLLPTDKIEDIVKGELKRESGENVGTYKIQQGTLTINSNYTLTEFNEGIFTINAKALTISADPKSKIYGQVDPILTYTVSGLLPTDKIEDIIKGELKRESGENVGTYNIEQGTLTIEPNYKLAVFNESVFTIKAKELTISADPKSKIYGQKDPQLTYTVSGLLPTDRNEDVVKGELKREIGENVGTYKIQQGTLTINSNYTLTVFNEGLFVIKEKGIIIIPDPQAKRYGHDDPELTYKVTGLYPEDKVEDIISGKLSRKDGEAVGIYPINIGSLAVHKNYILEDFREANLVISKAELSIIAIPNSKVYGHEDPEFDYQVEGLLSSEDINEIITGKLNRTPGEDVKEYEINLGTLSLHKDYTLTSFTSAKFNIIPAELTISADPKAKLYGEIDPVLTYTVSGLLPTEKVEDIIKGELKRENGENVGTYKIRQGTLTINSNYTLIGFNEGTLTINAKALTISANPKSKIYGQKDPELTYTVSGLLPTDRIEDVVKGELKRESGENVGTYEIQQGTLTIDSNYTLTAFNKGTFTINAKALTISADPKSKIYGQIDPVLTYTVSGLLPTDKIEDIIKGELKRESGENVGTYKIHQGTLTIDSNYTLTAFNKGTFTIIAKALTVSADPKSKIYGQIDPVLTYTVSGLLPTDKIENIIKGKLKRESGENVGTYKIQQGTLTTNSNYTLTVFNPAIFTINSKELTISADPKSKIYGQNDPELTYKVSGLLPNDKVEDIIKGELKRESGENVGTYTIEIGTLRINSNYTLTAFNKGTFMINAKALTISADPKSKIYREVDPQLTFTVSGLLPNDNIEDIIKGELKREEGEDVGKYLIDQGDLTLHKNYRLDVFNTAILTITPIEITITAHSLSKFYGEKDPELTFTVSGLHSTEIINKIIKGYLKREKGESVGYYAIQKGTLNLNPNYHLVLFNEGTFEIKKADQTIDFKEIDQIIIEDTPTLQLTAKASSGLPITYSVSDNEIATLDTRGKLTFLRLGTITVTAKQDGDNNYNPAEPVERIINITSRDANIWDLIVDDVSYGRISQDLLITIDCDPSKSEIVLEVETHYGATVHPSKYIVVPLNHYGLHKQLITVTSASGAVVKTYTIWFDRRIAADNLVFQKYNNVLLVNNNPLTNGGYRFIAYTWYKNGQVIGNKQLYSSGDLLGNALDKNAEYRIKLTLEDGKTITSCPIDIQNTPQNYITIYPNPVQKNSILNIKFSEQPQQSMINYIIYNTSGQRIMQGELSIYNLEIFIPPTIATGSYFLVIEGGEKEKQRSIPFIVKD